MVRLDSKDPIELSIAQLSVSLMADERAGTKSEEYFKEIYDTRLMIYNIVINNSPNYSFLKRDKNPYGDKTPTEQFEEIYRKNLEVLKKFPREVLDLVADERVLALGLGTKQLKNTLKRLALAFYPV